MKLSHQEKLKYARIIFNSAGRQKIQIRSLTQQQLQILRNIYAQKIAYQAINGRIQQYRYQRPLNPQGIADIPSLWESLFCLCYPSSHQEYFDITTTTFLQRSFYPFFFWNDNFFDIRDDSVQYYGFSWLLLTYAIILGFSSTLSSFFVHPENFQINYWILVEGIGLVYICKILQCIILTSAVGCLGGSIFSVQAMMLSGYSIVLYIVPTILCMAPSLYWHVLMLAAACIFRTIFVARNFAKKLQSRVYIMFLAVFACELVYFFLVLRIMFGDDSGYTFYQGYISIFGNPPVIQQDENTVKSNQVQNGTNGTNGSMTHGRYINPFYNHGHQYYFHSLRGYDA